jgi:hypothetical protein
MWLKIEGHPNHESARIVTNSNPGSGRRGDLAIAASPSRTCLNSRGDAESVSSYGLSMSAAWAAAHLRKKFPHFCVGGVSEKIFLKAPPVAE